MVKKNGCFYSYVLSYIILPHIVGSSDMQWPFSPLGFLVTIQAVWGHRDERDSPWYTWIPGPTLSAVKGKYLPLWQRLSPVSKEVCDFSGVSRLPRSKATSQNQVSWLQRICVYLCFSGHSYMACVHSICSEGWWWHPSIIISSSCQCPWCWVGTHKMLKQWL